MKGFTMTTPARATFDRIVHVETMLWNRCDEEVRQRTGLPLARVEVLRIIAEVEKCRVNDIVSRLLITGSAVSKLVDRLEASGHCTRQPNPDDRRSSVISVTDRGKRALAEAEEVLEPLLQQYLIVADLNCLDRFLVQVEQALSQAVGSVTDLSNDE
jgi:DNA-binding MarR family transcriptional regulator